MRILPVVLSALALVAAVRRGAPAQVCVGDCNGDHEVTVDEVLVMVNVALGLAPVTQCLTGDADQDGGVSVDELLLAVGNVLNGCRVASPSPTSLATATHTSTLPPSVAPTATPTPVPTVTTTPTAAATATPTSAPSLTCTNPLVDTGLRRLAEGNLREAHAAFAQALAAAPDDACAIVYHSITLIPTLMLDDARLSDLLRRSGAVVSGDSRDVCAFSVKAPDAVPATAPAIGEIVDTLRVVLLPGVTQALADLGRVSAGVNIRFDLRQLPECARLDADVDTVELDLADVRILEAALHAFSAVLELLGAYDLNVGLQPAIDLKPRTVLEAHPQLLTLRAAANLAAARQHLDSALAKVVEAIDAIRDEVDDQDDDVVVIDPEDRKDADRARLLASFVRQALAGEVTLPIDVVTGEIILMDIGLLQPERLNLNLFFSGQFASIRPFLPGFDEAGNLKLSSLPDPTFGGTAPDLTVDKINDIFDGGPECASCTTEGDCNPFGIGEYECRPCMPEFSPCTGAARRCSGGFASCDDGVF